MKIGIISDTHDHIENLKPAIARLQAEGIKKIYHCGDWVAPFTFKYLFEQCDLKVPVLGVLGNNDGDHFSIASMIHSKKWELTIDPDIIEDEVDGVSVVVYHGTDENITDSLINCKKYELVMTGHTHEALVKREEGLTHINPGTASNALSGPRLGKPTVAVYDSSDKSSEIINFMD